MIEESGRVVAIEPGAVWVETRRSTTCSGCSARNGCGQGLLDRLGVDERGGLVRALSDLQLVVGDAVVIGIGERILLRGAVLVYLFPLLGLFGAALAASALSVSEPYVMLAGMAGFFVCWLIVRRRGRTTAGDPALQPIVLRAMFAAVSGNARGGPTSSGETQFEGFTH